MHLIILIFLFCMATPAISEVASGETPASLPELLDQKSNNIVLKKNIYKIFEIVSPKDQETIQNQPDVTVIFKVEPELGRKDSLQLVVDGSPWGAPVHQTQITLTNPDRGTHQLSGQLLDGNGMVIRTAGSITVYVHRASVAFKNNSTPNLGPV